jgi:hypothetical protein
MSGGSGRNCRWWPKPAKATTCRREPASRERAGRAPDTRSTLAVDLRGRRHGSGHEIVGLGRVHDCRRWGLGAGL